RPRHGQGGLPRMQRRRQWLHAVSPEYVRKRRLLHRRTVVSAFRNTPYRAECATAGAVMPRRRICRLCPASYFVRALIFAKAAWAASPRGALAFAFAMSCNAFVALLA